MKFDDIIGEKEELEDKISRGIDKEIIEFVKEEAKKDKDDCVCYNGLRLGTPKELEHLIDVSFEILAELKKYKKRFGDIERYRSCFIEFDDGSSEVWDNGKLVKTKEILIINKGEEK